MFILHTIAVSFSLCLLWEVGNKKLELQDKPSRQVSCYRLLLPHSKFCEVHRLSLVGVCLLTKDAQQKFGTMSGSREKHSSWPSQNRLIIIVRGQLEKKKCWSIFFHAVSLMPYKLSVLQTTREIYEISSQSRRWKEAVLLARGECLMENKNNALYKKVFRENRWTSYYSLVEHKDKAEIKYIN